MTILASVLHQSKCGTSGSHGLPLISMRVYSIEGAWATVLYPLLKRECSWYLLGLWWYVHLHELLVLKSIVPPEEKLPYLFTASAIGEAVWLSQHCSSNLRCHIKHSRPNWRKAHSRDKNAEVHRWWGHVYSNLGLFSVCHPLSILREFENWFAGFYNWSRGEQRNFNWIGSVLGGGS